MAGNHCDSFPGDQQGCKHQGVYKVMQLTAYTGTGKVTSLPAHLITIRLQPVIMAVATFEATEAVASVVFTPLASENNYYFRPVEI